MRYWFILFLFSASVCAQSIHAASPIPQHNTVRDDDDDDDDDSSAPSLVNSKLPPKTPVITIEGVCDKGSQVGASVKGSSLAKSNCATIVNREDFEELADAMQVNGNAAKIQQLADSYAQFLVLQNEAIKLGLDKGERYKELMKFARAQILAQELDRHLQQKEIEFSEREISDYYVQNPLPFTRVSFQRIFVPQTRRTPGGGAPNSSDSAQTMKEVAQALREKAVAGQDFDSLERQAFAAAGLKGSAPTSMSPVRPSDLPAGHSQVFAMNNGEVSPVIADATGFYIYKMISQQILPLDQVKEEIPALLKARKMDKFSRKLQTSAKIVLNTAYFSPPNTQSPPDATKSGPGALQEHAETLGTSSRP